MNFSFIVGIDEAGRGPLAGPVSIGAVCIKKENYKEIHNFCKKNKLRDSKKLSEKQREIWYKNIILWQKEEKLKFKVSLISAKIIDNIGISQSIKKGMKNCLSFLKVKGDISKILLDGGLYLPEEYKNQKTIIKGDEKEFVIALASICAKVTRDRYMVSLSKKYPNYLFDLHKGYGTKKHYDVINRFGLMGEHRKTFLKNI